MQERTTTVEMDENGRCYIPKPVRKSLGIYDEEAILELDVKVLNRDSGPEKWETDHWEVAYTHPTLDTGWETIETNDRPIPKEKFDADELEAGVYELFVVDGEGRLRYPSDQHRWSLNVTEDTND